ncbi:GTP cyclohydrolase [Pedobacter sp. PAMC26386]|nr:GTP cyclohydrolase [Pedobacter sp. PAMC26386]
MFIISIHYTAPLEEMDKHIPEHVKFLDRYYEKNIFMASGRKVPRTGGAILAIASSIEAIEKIILEDPFHKLKLAEYTITEFIPTKFHSGLEGILG